MCLSEYGVQKMQSYNTKSFSSVKFDFFLSYGNVFENVIFQDSYSAQVLVSHCSCASVLKCNGMCVPHKQEN